jgi:hypothetical protein
MFTRFLVLGGLCAASLAAAGCATAPGVEAAAGPQECRDIVLPGREAASTICGTPQQFAEMERRLAASAPNLICREMLVRNSNMIGKFCGTETQWREFARAESRSAQSQVWGLQGGAYNSGR